MLTVHDQVHGLPGLLSKEFTDGVIGVSRESNGLVQTRGQGLLMQLKGLAAAQEGLAHLLMLLLEASHLLARANSLAVWLSCSVLSSILGKDLKQSFLLSTSCRSRGAAGGVLRVRKKLEPPSHPSQPSPYPVSRSSHQCCWDSSGNAGRHGTAPAQGGWPCGSSSRSDPSCAWR